MSRFTLVSSGNVTALRFVIDLSSTGVVWRNKNFRGGRARALVTHAEGSVKIKVTLSRPLKVEVGQYIKLWIPSVSFSSFLQSSVRGDVLVSRGARAARTVCEHREGPCPDRINHTVEVQSKGILLYLLHLAHRSQSYLLHPSRSYIRPYFRLHHSQNSEAKEVEEADQVKEVEEVKERRLIRRK